MTPINLKVQRGNKTETINCSIPSCWEELKTRHYIRIIKEWEDGTDIADRDYFKLFNILSDGQFTGLENTVENHISLMDMVGWVITQPFEFSKELPKVLSFHVKSIDIPPHPRELSIGQNIHLRRDYIDKSQKIEENISIATAIYLQPIIDNSLFKIRRAEEIRAELDEMPASLIYPIGFFLAERALNFGMRPTKIWNLPKISLKQILGQMWHAWRKSIH